jgi:cytochrome c553
MKVQACLFIIVSLLGCITSASGGDNKSVEYQDPWINGVPNEPGEAWSIAYGGRLYDQWAVAQGKTLPETTHPSYPAVGKAKGWATWRCKECHGWDYKGAAGAYASGSSFTGIKGIRAYAGASPQKIAEIIRNPTHRYTPEMIPDAALKHLALFVSKGQIDTDRILDGKTKKILKGNAQRGRDVFQNLCAICHGFDGKAQNLAASPPAYVGTIANQKPAELLHKVRNGFPGMPMPSNSWWDEQTLADVAAYAQTLPEK